MFLIVLCAMLWMAAWTNGKPPVWLALMSAAILGGFVLLVRGGRAQVRIWRFRKTRLVLPAIPGVVGGSFRAGLRLPQSFPAGVGVQATLKCVHTFPISRGKSIEIGETLLWKNEQKLSVYPYDSGRSAEVEFQIPPDVRGTEGVNPLDEIFWYLTAEAETNASQFSVKFRVPVFEIRAGSPATDTVPAGFRPDQIAPAMQSAAPSPASVGAGPRAEPGYVSGATRIWKVDLPQGGEQFCFAKPGPRWGPAAVGIFFLIFMLPGACAAFIAGFLMLLAGGPVRWIGLILWIVTAGFVAPIAGFGLWLAFGERTVSVANGQVCVRYRCLVWSRSTIVKVGEIHHLDCFPAGPAGVGLRYRVKLRLLKGGTVPLGPPLEKNESDWFAANLRSQLAL